MEDFFCCKKIFYLSMKNNFGAYDDIYIVFLYHLNIGGNDVILV